MKKAFILITLFFPVVITSWVFPTTYYVNGTTGNDLWDGLAAAWDGTHGPKKTIQAGINSSTDTDTVIVTEGTYTGNGNRNIDFVGKAIVLEGQGGADVTIIDCESSARGFYFHSGEGADSVVDGFTITNGYASDYGGGIYCSGSSPAIINCKIIGNEAFARGGGGIIFGSGSAAIMENCTISSNAAPYAGGILCEVCAPALTNCTITGNTAVAIGGGIVCVDSDITIMECIVSDNDAGGNGGGIIFVDTWSDAEVKYSSIINNSAANGGGIHCYNSRPQIMFSHIDSNLGAINGGGIACQNNSDPSIFGCDLDGNEAGYGGGIYCGESSPSIINCKITNGAADVGGGIYFWKNKSGATNCTIAYNYGGENAGGVYCSGVGTLTTIRNCIVWDNGLEEIYDASGTLFVEYCDVEGGWTGTGNIDAEPLFVPGALHDYYLSQTVCGQAVDSPCIDAGSDTAANLGLDALSTRTDGLSDNGTVDMGYHAPYALWIYRIERRASNIVVYWNELPSTNYTIQWSADMGIWNDVPVGVTDNWTDVGGALASERYYRVKEE